MAQTLRAAAVLGGAREGETGIETRHLRNAPTLDRMGAMIDDDGDS
jgi:hypothetical protein